MITYLFLIGALGVRTVSVTSCEVVRVNVSLGMTTQLHFEQKPELSLHSDHQHFQIKHHEHAKNSLAIIPSIRTQEVENHFRLSDGSVRIPNDLALSRQLDESFRTNLFVFFKNDRQLMFELRFVPKSKVDYVVHVKEKISRKCVL